MEHYLDTELLAKLTRSKRGSRGLREISGEIGDVSPSTLSRVENGKMPDMETFLLLCDWLEVPPAALIKNKEVRASVSDLDPSEALAIQLRADKNLDPATANALAALVKAAYRDLPKRSDTRTGVKASMGLIEDLSPEFKRSCEAIATEQRSSLNLRAFDRLPAYDLATHLDATILTPEQLLKLEQQHLEILLTSDTWSAAVICQHPLQIVHNPRHAVVRRESNLMHELGHILLKHPMIGFDPKTGLPLRRQQDEKEAIYLGGCLQIPHRGLLWAVQREMSLLQIAEHFGASKDMVLFRSNAVGVRQSVK